MSPRRDCRKDDNHDDIAEAFRMCGWRFIDTYQHAQYTPGFPDGLAVRGHRTVWVEVKTAQGTLTDKERMFRDYELAGDGEYEIVRTLEDVERITQRGWEER